VYARPSALSMSLVRSRESAHRDSEVASHNELSPRDWWAQCGPMGVMWSYDQEIFADACRARRIWTDFALFRAHGCREKNSVLSMCGDTAASVARRRTTQRAVALRRTTHQCAIVEQHAPALCGVSAHGAERKARLAIRADGAQANRNRMAYQTAKEPG
jgi:hypothetical protein